ncbi:MAG: alpha-glucan phosphorylase, partial [Methanothrix soehngenii]|nr:alpha-glucan phosphorylase [Methanothrix soehngenii]
GADDGLQRDAKDAASIYTLLEKDIVPLYYNLGEDGIPHGWVTVMKEAIRMNGPNFSATRMAKEYTDKFYRQAIDAAMMERQKKERGFVKQDLFGRF